ncbi:MAG: 16S rRNA (guanine(966)-N(2))-methyltransferase RsmD [Terriglobales bacterium]|jgi:16S rRNA (guanine966-N2)-methyltransferase
MQDAVAHSEVLDCGCGRKTMRVIAGKFRSRKLKTLPGMEVRPTSDRLRETLFDILTAGNPEALEGMVWIDLYAGTGAVGIEALSRGAGMVYFVESAPDAAELIRKNLDGLGVKSGFQVLRQDAVRALQAWDKSAIQANFVFMDPPYRMEETYGQVLTTLSISTLLLPEAIVIVEHQKKFDPGEQVASLQRYRLLKQGDAALSFYRKG